MKYKYLREEVYAANMTIKEFRLAQLTWGNVSQIDRENGVFAIKPSGVSYEDLSPANMVLVTLEGVSIDGTYKPSSDTKTHLELYKAFDTMGGIAHTHSPYATAWAQAKMSIPVFGTTHADHTIQSIPCTEVMEDAHIVNNYEEETGKQIITCLEHCDPTQIEMILVACHGPFTWGGNAALAIKNSIVLEEIAKMALFTKQINSDARELKDTLKKKHYERKHGANAYYGQ